MKRRRGEQIYTVEIPVKIRGWDETILLDIKADSYYGAAQKVGYVISRLLELGDKL